MNISTDKKGLLNARLRFSQTLKSQMIKIKAETGLENWNTLCRWALCFSLELDNEPPEQRFQNDSNLEISWQVIAGDTLEPLTDLILSRYKKLTEDHESGIESYVKCHIARGLNLASKSIEHGAFRF